MTFPLPWWVRPVCAVQDFFWALFHPFAWLGLVRSRRSRRAAWIAAGRPPLDQHGDVVVLAKVGNLKRCDPVWYSGSDPLPDPHETARALAASAGPTITELERRQRAEERRDRAILWVVIILSAAVAVAGALSWAGVQR